MDEAYIYVWSPGTSYNTNLSLSVDMKTVHQVHDPRFQTFPSNNAIAINIFFIHVHRFSFCCDFCSKVIANFTHILQGCFTGTGIYKLIYKLVIKPQQSQLQQNHVHILGNIPAVHKAESKVCNLGQKQELYVIWWVIMVGCDRCNCHWFYAWEAYLTAIIIIHLEYQGDCKEEWEWITKSFSTTNTSLAECKTMVYPVCWQWRYHILTLSHWSCEKQWGIRSSLLSTCCRWNFGIITAENIYC